MDTCLPLSLAGRRYGRIEPPPLPKHMMLTEVKPVIPDAVDLRAWGSPVKDQGDEGSCTAQANTSAAEWIFRKYFNKSPIFSPQYTYAEELMYTGDFPNDVGSDGQTACLVAIHAGFCDLSLYPYVAGQINRPTAQQESDARKWALGAYHGVAGSKVALSVLGDPVPWPLLVGFTVYESFESEELAETGVMPIPKRGESVLGGHEVCGCGGYDVGVKPTFRPANCPPSVLIQNSWGPSWGLDGFFWMPVSILDSPDTDIKICHAGKAWVPKTS